MCSDFAMPLPSHPGGVPVRKNNERRKGPLHSVHEKAGQAEIRCYRFSKTGDANQWDARRFQRLFPSMQSPNRHAPIRTVRGAIAPVPASVLVSSIRRVMPSRNRTALPLLAEACVPSRRRSHPDSIFGERLRKVRPVNQQTR